MLLLRSYTRYHHVKRIKATWKRAYNGFENKYARRCGA